MCAGLRHNISHQPLFAQAVIYFARKNNAASYSGVLSQYSFYVLQLNAHAAYLDLMISTAQTLYAAIRQVPS